MTDFPIEGDPRPIPPPAPRAPDDDARGAVAAPLDQRSGARRAADAPLAGIAPAPKVPPHNFEAEMALLGAILANNRAYERVSDFLRGEHFADARHGTIYATAGRLIEAGVIADPVTLKNHFEAAGTLADIGGAAYLARLAASVVTIINAEDYGRTIHDRWLGREILYLVAETEADVRRMDVGLSARAVLERTEARLAALGGAAERAEGRLVPLKEALRDAVAYIDMVYKADGAVIGVPTGIGPLDNLLGGLLGGELYILAGRPSMGKTALSTAIAANAATTPKRGAKPGPDGRPPGYRVGIFSIEVAQQQLSLNLIALRVDVSSHVFRRRPSRDQLGLAMAAERPMGRWPILIDATAPTWVATMKSRARRARIDLAIVDYLQLVDGAEPGQSPENNVVRVSQITKALKAMAKTLGIPVLALSQLSRQVESREDKRPQLSDLRESGSIEQDADAVLFVYREGYYLERARPKSTDPAAIADWEAKCALLSDRCEVIVAKQRHGPIGDVVLRYRREVGRFESMGAYDERMRNGWPEPVPGGPDPDEPPPPGAAPGATPGRPGGHSDFEYR